MTKQEFIAALIKGGFITDGSLALLFDTHPEIEMFYVTSDGQAFFEKTMAEAHGQKLPVRDVCTFDRSDVIDTPSTEQTVIDLINTVMVDAHAMNEGTEKDINTDEDTTQDGGTDSGNGNGTASQTTTDTITAQEPTFAELKAKYKEVTGKNVGVGMSADKIKAAIAEAEQKTAEPQN